MPDATTTLALAAFLEARLAEDEAAALAAVDDDGERWAAFGLRYETWDASVLLADSQVAVARADSPSAAHIARHDPARVLAEVAAKRAVLALSEKADRPVVVKDYDAGATEALHAALRHLAAIYSDHADYDPSWAVS